MELDKNCATMQQQLNEAKKFHAKVGFICGQLVLNVCSCCLKIVELESIESSMANSQCQELSEQLEQLKQENKVSSPFDTK